MDIYILDSSSWLAIDKRWKSYTNPMIGKIGSLVSRGRTISPPEVFNELKKLETISKFIQDNKNKIKHKFSSEELYLKYLGEIT